jgi:galactokinase
MLSGMTSSPASESVAASLADRFRQRYRVSPEIFRAPGRVNLIGEHTDYNDGFVMPVAIEFYTWVATSARTDRILCVYSEQFNESAEFALDALAGEPRHHWSDFIRGVAAVLQAHGHKLRGVNLQVEGCVPMGSGLSSSASLEVATALALLSASHTAVPPLEIAPLELAKDCQQAEHEYVGTRCGIMDQFISVFGRAGYALMLDCRSLNYETLAIPTDTRLVICNTMVKHAHASNGYNQRRADCETGVAILRQQLPNITALRDVTLSDLERFGDQLSEVVYRRCHHVVSENQRVLDAASSLRSSDLSRFGRLMAESHQSLRDNYEVSCRELDLLVEIATGCEGVYGSRMTGGGFGGCTVTLVQSGAVVEFQRRVKEAYKNQTGIAPDVWVCSAAQGAGAWPGSL